MIPTSAACNWIRRSALWRSSEFQCGKPITPSFSSLRKIYVFVPYDSLVAFREQLCSFIRAIHIEPNVPPLHGWWVFFMPRPYFCPSGREVTISDVFAEHPKPQGYMLGFRCVLVTLKTPLGGNLWNSIFLLPNDNGRK